MSLPSDVELGVAYFNPRFLFERPYFMGEFFESGLLVPVSWEPAANVIVFDNLAGGQILQVLFTGEKGPALNQPYPFDLNFLATRQNDLERLMMAKSMARTVTFSAGFRVCDVFPFAETGQSYTLSRPSAVGVVPGTNTGYHEPKFYVDGVLDPTAGTITGQTFAAAASGEIAVHYTPLHSVIVESFTGNMQNFNKAGFSVRLREIISGDFG